MATKKAKTTKNVKGAKMATKTTTKAKARKTEAKAGAVEREVVTIKPYEGPIKIIPNDRGSAVEARAEAVEVLDGLDPEARAEAVEALDELEIEPKVDETATAPAADATPAPVETDQAGEAERLLLELGFQKTGRIIEDVRPKALRCAAETWRDRKDRESKIAAEDVASRAGWFRAPGAAPAATTAPAPTDAPSAPATPAPQTPDLAALRVEVEEAKTALAASEADVKRAEEEARAALAKAKERYRAALAPYRDACKVQGHACEYEGGGRGANVSEKVTFVVERVGDDIRIAVKDRAETVESVPVADVRAALNKTAYGYTDRHVGPRQVVGNKGGTLSNKLRAVLEKA